MKSLSQRIRSERLARKIPQGTDLQESSFTPGQASYHAVYNSQRSIQDIYETSALLKEASQEDCFPEPEDSKYDFIFDASETELGEEIREAMDGLWPAEELTIRAMENIGMMYRPSEEELIDAMGMHKKMHMCKDYS